jgi:hypothetical protein
MFGLIHIFIDHEIASIVITFVIAFVCYSNFTTILYCQYEFFPTEILGFVLGAANGTARIVTIFTPFFIETISEPMMLLCGTSLLGTFVTMMLITSSPHGK